MKTVDRLIGSWTALPHTQLGHLSRFACSLPHRGVPSRWSILHDARCRSTVPAPMLTKKTQISSFCVFIVTVMLSINHLSFGYFYGCKLCYFLLPL